MILAMRFWVGGPIASSREVSHRAIDEQGFGSRG